MKILRETNSDIHRDNPLYDEIKKEYPSIIATIVGNFKDEFDIDINKLIRKSRFTEEQSEMILDVFNHGFDLLKGKSFKTARSVMRSIINAYDSTTKTWDEQKVISAILDAEDGKLS